MVRGPTAMVSFYEGVNKEEEGGSFCWETTTCS